jgi:hypothetical protein
MNIMPLAITALRHSGYNVFHEVAAQSSCRLVAVKDGVHLCQVRVAIKDHQHSPILRIGKIPPNTSHIIAVNTHTGEVWVIPVADVAGLETIRLGKRWEDKKYTIIVYEGMTEGDDSTLASMARKVAENLDKEKQNVSI